MSAEVKRMKEEGRKRSAPSGEAVAPARHSGEGRNSTTSSFRTPRSGDLESSFVGNSFTLGDLLTIIRGVTYKKEDASAEPDVEGVPILRATNIQHGRLTFDGLVYVPRRCVSDEQLLHVGDIVVAASSGSRNVVGKAAPVKVEWFGSFGAFCFGLRPKSGVDPDYLAWFLQTSEYRQQVSELAAGININNLRAKHIEQIPIPVPTIERQRSIVAEIEKQFTRLDAGVAALRRVQASLKCYRAAVLKAACEGRLVPTEAELAKAERRTYETGEQLLARILADRRKNWQGRGKYKEPAAPDTKNLPPLPEGWAWARAEQLCEFITKGTTPASTKMFSGQGDIPFLKVYNLTFTGALNLDYKPVFVSRSTHEGELRRSEVRAGDILINIVGPPLGQVSVVPPAVKQANINQAIARFRAVSPECRAQLALCLMTRDVMACDLRSLFVATQAVSLGSMVVVSSQRWRTWAGGW